MTPRGSSGPPVRLRPLEDGDGDAYFAYQREPAANAMADFPARDRAAFDRHWATLRSDASATSRAITVSGRFVGVVTAWGDDPERELAYWLGQEFWGRGTASAAVGLFLEVERARPLSGHVAAHHLASRRVLEKVGFRYEREVVQGDVRLALLVLH